MVLITAAILTGLLWSGAIPDTAPWTSAIFGLVLFQWAFSSRKSS